MKPYPDNGCYSCYAASISQHSAIIRGINNLFPARKLSCPGNNEHCWIGLVWRFVLLDLLREHETQTRNRDRRCVTRVAGMLKWAGYLMRVPSVYLCIDLSSREFYEIRSRRTSSMLCLEPMHMGLPGIRVGDLSKKV